MNAVSRRFYEVMRAHPPETQNECCEIAAHIAIAQAGIVPEYLIRSASIGLARGLFGDAYKAATQHQRRKWIDMAEREYRRVAGRAPTPPKPEGGAE